MFYWYNKHLNNFTLSDIPNGSILPQIVWVITDKCPYKCPFCFQPKTNTSIDLNDALLHVSLFKKLGMQKVDISGGEPLLFPNFPQLAQILADNQIHMTVSSNGSGSKENREWLLNNHRLFSRILFSMNGYSPTHHNRICGVDGAFEKMESLVCELKNRNCMNIRINTVITPELINRANQDSLFSTIRYLSPLEWCLIQPHPENQLPTFEKYQVSIYRFSDFVRLVETEFKGTGIRIISRNNVNYSGYWVLNPDGNAFLHTDGIRHPISLEFCEQNLNQLTAISNQYGLWLPSNQ